MQGNAAGTPGDTLPSQKQDSGHSAGSVRIELLPPIFFAWRDDSTGNASLSSSLEPRAPSLSAGWRCNPVGDKKEGELVEGPGPGAVADLARPLLEDSTRLDS
jgi:hypothetical protein